ncbi:protocatechuate 3,4-dioxygenase beta subunit [Algoriphagus sp. 4150]|uniref:dioxygenase family protein n=1 Tax=Algoriphagus sp. 4150 TaxID=2817756 RepID=UPI00285EE7A5|nr:intradiol ring-cleavage dioxygenase [Algoriphagus sp. 4150]MDR7128518.1 protocatechuate 3,4-dioxygenase beta subunit [Algoriphagus sp. 4150]
MKNLTTAILMVFLQVSFACQSQTNSSKSDRFVGGGCEGCEAIFEFGDKKLSHVDTLPHFFENKPKLEISGSVFHKDGKTPAANVIIYIYHTNREGEYQTYGNEKGWAKRHGVIRGWVKTDAGGTYTFYTFRPAAYPSRDEPEHIHITIKEPGKTAYYLDDFMFEDDPLLTKEKRENLEDRGGSGIMKPSQTHDMLTIRRDIILGQNIPDYE